MLLPGNVPTTMKSRYPDVQLLFRTVMVVCEFAADEVGAVPINTKQPPDPPTICVFNVMLPVNPFSPVADKGRLSVAPVPKLTKDSLVPSVRVKSCPWLTTCDPRSTGPVWSPSALVPVA